MKKTILTLLLLAALLFAWSAAPAEGAIDAEAWRDRTTEQAEVVDEMYTIDDFAVTDGLPDRWVNILLLGADNKYTEYAKGQYGRTDGIVLLSLNPAAKKAKLTSFLRDLWVEIPGTIQGGRLAGAAQIGGPALTVQVINELFDMGIQYYVLVNLSRMAEIIDLMGGLDLDVTEDEMRALNEGLFDLSPLSGMEPLMEYGSEVHLNGNQAVAYIRVRKIDSDYRRTERARYALTALAKRLQQEDAGAIVGLAQQMLQCVETNMDFTQLMTIARVGMEMDMDTVEQLRIPAQDTYKTGTINDVWCIRADVDENKKLLHTFIYGER